MRLLDVNVVLAASRDDHPHFPVARPWLDQLLEGDERFAVPDTVWVAFVRLTTNRRIFGVPASLDDAFGYLRALRAQPNHVALQPVDRHLEFFERQCREAEAVGDLAPDAELAALAVEHGAELVSFDRDFARFAGLRWVRPEPSGAGEEAPG